MARKKNNNGIAYWSRMIIFACLLWIIISILNSMLLGLMSVKNPNINAILNAIFSGVLVYLVVSRLKLKAVATALQISGIFIVVTILLDVLTAGNSIPFSKLLHWHYWIQFALYPIASLATLDQTK